MSTPQTQTQQPTQDCPCCSSGSDARNNSQLGPLISGALQSTSGGSSVNAREFTSPAYFTYSTDSTCCKECISIPLKSGGSLSLGWNRLGGLDALSSAYTDTWMPGGAGGVFSLLPQVNLTSPPRVYSDLGTIGFDTNSNPLSQLAVSAARGTTYFTTYDSVGGVYFEYFAGSSLSTSDARFGRLNRRYDTDGNVVQYNYTNNAQGKALLRTLSGDISGNLVPYFGYSNETIDAAHFAPVSKISLQDQVASANTRTVYFEYQNYTDGVTGNTYPYLKNIINPQGCTQSFDPIVPFNTTGDAYQVYHDVDPLGYETYFSYNAGSMAQVNEPEGRVTYYTYTAGSQTQQTQQGRNSRFVNYALNTQGDQLTQVTQHTDPLGNTTYFGYDQTLSRIAQKIDPNGNLSYYEYVGGSALNKFAPTRQLSTFNGAQTYFGYATNSYDLLKKVGPRWTAGTTIEVTYYRYDTFRNRTAMVDAAGNLTYWGYDSLGHVRKVFDARKNTTYYTYGSTDGARSAMIDALGNVTYYGYNSFQNLTAQVSPRWKEKSFASFTTYYAYDQLNRKTKDIDAQNNVTYYNYDSRGDMLDTVDAVNATTAYTYSGLRLRTQSSVTDSAGTLLAQTKDGFDQYKNRVQSQDGLGNVTYFFFDQADRPTGQLDALQNATYFYYDSVGDRTVATDPRGNSTYFFYDQISRNNASRDALGNYTYFFYDLANNLTAQVEALQYASYFFYDALDRRQATRDTLGNPTYFFYDPVSNLSVQMDARFNSAYFGYDALNRRTQAMDALGNTTYFTYDTKGNRTKVVNARSNATYFFYDTLDRANVTADALFNPTYFFFDAVSNRTQVMDARFNTTYYFYDGLRRTNRMRDALGNPAYFFFDLVGNRTVTMDARFNSTYFGYDKLNRQTAIEDALGDTTYFVYDPAGNRIQVVDARGGNSLAGYDSLNRTSVALDPLGNAIYFFYDAVGNLIARDRGVDGYGVQAYGTTPYGGTDGATSYFFYDGLRRRTATRDPLGNYTYFFFDPVGNQTVLRDPLANSAYFGYDSINRLTKAQDALGNTTYYEFDATSNLTKILDPDGHAFQAKYDTVNRPSSVRTADGGSSYFFYDPVSNRTSDVDPLGNPVYYGYDVMNRPLRIQDGLNQSLYFEYDAVSNLSKFVDGEGASASFTFDAVNRKTNVTYAAAGAIVPDGLRTNPYYVFDPASNVTQIGDVWGLHLLGYDAGNRLAQHQYPNGNVVYYLYDNRWNQTGRVYPGSSGTQSAAYDGLDRQTQVQAPSGATAYCTYDAASNLTQRVYGNNAKLVATYDAIERSAQWRYADKNGGSISYFDYTRDAKGLITKSFREANYTIYYTYDPNDRLASEIWANSGATPSEVYGYRYAYDGAGNRLKARVNGSDTYYAYDRANQLTMKGTTSLFASATYYVYDKNGSLISEVEPSGTTKFAYNAAGLVAKILWRDASATYFFYDGNLQRYAWIQNGSVNYFLWDGLDLLQELNSDGTVKEEYTQAKVPTPGIGQLVESNRPGQAQQKLYPVMDPRGTITKYVQSDGSTIFASREFDAFGNLIPNSATGTWPGIFGYQGQAWTEILSTNGSQRYLLSPTRIYDPVDGHFVSRDPFRLGDPMGTPGRIQPWYHYVMNSPLVAIDRNGAEEGQNYVSLIDTSLGVNFVDFSKPINQPNVYTLYSVSGSAGLFGYQPFLRNNQNALTGFGGGAGVAFGAPARGQAGLAAWWAGMLAGMLGLPAGCRNYYASGCRVSGFDVRQQTGGQSLARGTQGRNGAATQGKLGPTRYDVKGGSGGIVTHIVFGFDIVISLTADSEVTDCKVLRNIYWGYFDISYPDGTTSKGSLPSSDLHGDPIPDFSIWPDNSAKKIYVYDAPGRPINTPINAASWVTFFLLRVQDLTGGGGGGWLDYEVWGSFNGKTDLFDEGEVRIRNSGTGSSVVWPEVPPRWVSGR